MIGEVTRGTRRGKWGPRKSYLGYVFRSRTDGPEYANRDLPGELWKPVTESYFQHREWLESNKKD